MSEYARTVPRQQVCGLAVTLLREASTMEGFDTGRGVDLIEFADVTVTASLNSHTPGRG